MSKAYEAKQKRFECAALHWGTRNHPLVGRSQILGPMAMEEAWHRTPGLKLLSLVMESALVAEAALELGTDPLGCE